MPADALVDVTAATPHALRTLLGQGALDLPTPVRGNSTERLRRLAAIASDDLSLARLAEAHVDAIAILDEADRRPVDGALYGVWASGGVGGDVSLVRRSGQLVASGRKRFCTGSAIVDRALVTMIVSDDDGKTQSILCDIDARHPAMHFDLSSWTTDAFASTNTGDCRFDDMIVSEDDIVGAPNWYLDRPGFWQGALAPAACWAGGATGLAAHCLESAGDRSLSPHQLAHLGALDFLTWQLGALIDHAGRALDDPTSSPDAPILAQRFRSSVEHSVSTLIDHALRAGGPRLLANDRWASSRVAELQLYVRQHHAESDHEMLGRLVCNVRSVGTDTT
jgi:alkylation response protein AidB-like acyl-CoA dehydrogenase